MSTLADIEAAVESLRPEEKQELLLYLAARLRAAGTGLPVPRTFSRDQIQAWITEDEDDTRRLREAE